MKIFLFWTGLWILAFLGRYLTDMTSWEPYGKLLGPLMVTMTLIYIWRHLDNESK